MEQKFWKKVKKGKETECWTWLGAKQKSGYGRFKIHGKLYGSHRVSYELIIGKIPPRLWVLHKCDNPSCVNPNHLFIGNRSKNMKDCAKKGRLHNNAKRKLGDKQVIEIKRLLKNGLSDIVIANKFKIKPSSVYSIKVGKSYK